VFIGVYITEAHASDEWPVGKSISCCTQPKSSKERCGLAKTFVEKRSYRFPILVDTIENKFQAAFAAWPFRFFIAKNNRLFYKAEPNALDLTYSIEDLDNLIPRALQNSIL